MIQVEQASYARRVFILGMDGAGNFLQRLNRSEIAGLARQRGVVTLDAMTELPTISAECWGAMLHGVTPDKHGCHNERAGAERFPLDSAYPSFFRLARERYPEWTLASFTAWPPINYGLVEEGIGVHKHCAPDAELTDAACEYIGAAEDVRLFYIALDAPDALGHQNGYDTPQQHQAIAEAEERLLRIVDAIDRRGWLEDSLLLFVTDHGGGGEHRCNHGSDHPMDRTIFWAAAGPCVNPNANLEGLTFKDTAAVVAAALGLPIPESWDARVPEALFRG
ncbi:alkaline phosphatase family protein [Paenibacillus dendritiformis]|uniref:alkaline phosphatase family protein n=1 Tax=Paenibacillus dendritiformis TaxID=130049 RepID=UPI00387E1857